MRSAAQASDPTRQTRPENALDLVVGGVLQSLEQAARGEHTAWALSNAMESVDLHYRKTGPISTVQRDVLLTAIVRAQLAVIEQRPDWCSADLIDSGSQALAGQVVLWAET